VEVLCHHASQANTSIGLAVHKRLDPHECSKLMQQGVEVLPVFESDGYRFNNQLPSVAELTPYTMQLACEYQSLMQQATERWPQRCIVWVFHTSPWQHLQALALSIARMPESVKANWQFHIYLMYWPGMDEKGRTVELALKTQYKQTLQRLARDAQTHFFTSTAAYVAGYTQLLTGSGRLLGLHPFFLGDWRAPCLTADQLPRAIKRVLAYSGDARDIKGFDVLPRCVQQILDRFEDLEQVMVHTAREPSVADSRNKQVWPALEALSVKDSRLILQVGFLSHQDLVEQIKSVDLLVLNYDREAYEHKTSGFVWLAAQLGVACAVTAGTWLEYEAMRLGMKGWRIQASGEWEPLPAQPAEEVFEYRQAVLQPYEDWLAAMLTEPILKQ
jgi:hypothetical protein